MYLWERPWKRHLGWSDNQEISAPIEAWPTGLQRSRGGKRVGYMMCCTLLTQDRRMCKGWWSLIGTDWDLPQGRPRLGAKGPPKRLASDPLMGPVQLEEGRVFFVLHCPCKKRAVSCTWEPGASAPFQIIHSPATEVLLRLGVHVL